MPGLTGWSASDIISAVLLIPREAVPQAEKALQEAAAQQDADSRVRQNLSLVLALEGKFDSAEEVSRRDLNVKDAASNVAAIRHMIAQSNTWKQIQALDSKPDPATKTKVGRRTN